MAEDYNIVVIDDERIPLQGTDTGDGDIIVTLYKNSTDGLAALKQWHETGTLLDELWLDHDLGYDDTHEFGFDTIMPVVLWLEEMGNAGTPLNVQWIFVHTANIAAAPRMLAALKPWYPRVTTANLPLEGS